MLNFTVETENLTAKISEITNQGAMRVKFSHAIDVPKNLSVIGQDFVDLYLKPSRVAEYNLKLLKNELKVNFTWEAASYDEKKHELTYQLEFEHFNFISSDLVNDDIVHFVKDQSLFLTKKTKSPILKDYLTISAKIPK